MNVLPNDVLRMTKMGWAGWCTPIIPAIGRMSWKGRQEFGGQPGLHKETLFQKSATWGLNIWLSL